MEYSSSWQGIPGGWRDYRCMAVSTRAQRVTSWWIRPNVGPSGTRCQHQDQSLADSGSQLGSMSHRSQTPPNNATDCGIQLLALGSPVPILIDLGHLLHVERQHSPRNQKCAKGQAQKSGPPPPTSSICRPLLCWAFLWSMRRSTEVWIFSYVSLTNSDSRHSLYFPFLS